MAARAASTRPSARAAAICVAALSVAACAAQQPMTVNSAFTDQVPRVAPAATKSPRAIPAKAASTPICRLNVAELVDARRSPELLGVVGGMAIKAPADPNAWLRSIIGGLETRGFGVSFEKQAAPAADTVVARLRLQSAWLNTTTTNKTATVVLHVKAERAGLPPIEDDVRSNLTRVDWNNSPSEMQHLVDAAFVGALDDMAVRFRRLCPSRPLTPDA